MSQGAPRGDATGGVDQANATDEGRAGDAGSAGGTTDGMRIEIGGDGGEYIRVSAGRTIAALVAVVGVIAIVAILAHPRLASALSDRAGSRDDGGTGGDDTSAARRESPAGDADR